MTPFPCRSKQDRDLEPAQGVREALIRDVELAGG